VAAMQQKMVSEEEVKVLGALGSVAEVVGAMVPEMAKGREAVAKELEKAAAARAGATAGGMGAAMDGARVGVVVMAWLGAGHRTALSHLRREDSDQCRMVL